VEIIEIRAQLVEQFGFDNKPSIIEEGTSYSRLNLNGQEFPLPVVLFGLLKGLECQSESRFEKTAWIFSFSVRGTTCFASSEKFGLRVYVPEHLGERFARMVRGMLLVGVRKYAKVLKRQIVQDQIGLNDFGFLNQTNFLRRGYSLFREKAEEAYSQSLENGQRSPIAGEGSFSITFNQEPWWFSFGATVSFFSYLEHLYSGLYGCTGTRHTVLDLQHFMSLSWRKKHIKLFTEAGIYDANQYGRLDEIFQQQRNHFSHGLSGKNGASIYHLVPEVGLVPLDLRSYSHQPHFMFSKEHRETFLRNCSEFDDFETFLQESNLSHGMEWASSGLDFRFDANFMDDLDVALEEDKFDEFLEWQGYLSDSAANFED
jgi:hypothetical protein